MKYWRVDVGKGVFYLQPNRPISEVVVCVLEEFGLQSGFLGTNTCAKA